MPETEAQQIEALGPGGVSTPTAPENNGTPTPQPEPTGGLKPLGELLGKTTPEPAVAAVEPIEPAAPAEPAAPVVPADGAAARINKLTAEKWEEKRAREAAEARAKLAEETLAELARAAGQSTGEPGTEVVPSAAPSERRFTETELRTEAARIAAQTSYNEKVNKVVLDGRQAHADFDHAVEELKKITGPMGPPTEFLLAAMETGKAPDLIYELGKNPGEADRILSLPPIQQAVALARYADGLKPAGDRNAPAAVSNATAPIVPKIGGSARRELALDDPNLSLAEFIRRRNEMETAERQRKRA